MADDKLDVCVIDDDASQRALLLRWFLRKGYSVTQAGDGVEGLERIRQHRPRVVISDVAMPNRDGIDLCKAVRQNPDLAGTYFVMITAENSRERRTEALNAGADDCLVKPVDFDEMEAKVRNGLRISQLQERLWRAALTDGLTGLWNHGQFRELLDREFSRTRRYGGELSMLMIDLDHFKAVNDTYGHEVGNRVLKATARHLQRGVRDIDIVARYGGEEFAVICPQSDIDGAMVIAERIRETLPDGVHVPEHPELVVHASIGVVCSTDARVMSSQDLITCADRALYTAKARGRNQCQRGDSIADDFEDGPIQVGEVERLRKQVVGLSMQAKELCLQSVWALVQALEARDPFTAQHSRNVRFYAKCLVEHAGWPENLRVATANAAMLHDLGKIGVPDRVLQKPTPLTQSEAMILRQVPLITCKILEPLKVFETETLIIRHLRERFDGTGYPDGLSGTNIPIGSRLLAVVEAFDALTSDRAYRSSLPMQQALAEIRADAGAHFDPQFVDLLVRVVGEQQRRWQARVEQTRATLERAAIERGTS